MLTLKLLEALAALITGANFMASGIVPKTKSIFLTLFFTLPSRNLNPRPHNQAKQTS